jgi:hypothetical protein
MYRGMEIYVTSSFCFSNKKIEVRETSTRIQQLVKEANEANETLYNAKYLSRNNVQLNNMLISLKNSNCSEK